MKRDGACISLWQHKTPDYNTKMGDKLSQVFDVLIVGGGITGLSTALRLQKAGKQCLLAEAHTIGFGTTGGTTAHLNSFMDTPYYQIAKNFGENSAQLIAKIARQAIDLVKRNVQEYNIDCDFKELPGYLYSQDEKQTKELEDIFKSAAEAGVSVSSSDSIPVPIPFEKAIAFDKQAQIHPARYIYGLAKAFEEAGGILLQDCRITAVEENEILTITSSRGSFQAHNLIYATHIPPGVNLLHFRCAPYRSYAMGVKLKNKDYPDGLAYDLFDPYHYFRTHEVDGEKYLIAGGEDHKTAHEENTEICFTRLENYIRKYFDVEEVAFKWSSQYFEPTDGLPYIGHLPGHPDNMFVATGYGGNGIIYSTVASMVLTEMLVNGNAGEYEELFDPNRIKMVAGFSNFVKEAADVVGNLIGKRFTIPKLESFAELAADEAKVVKYEGHSIGIYKDENGRLHAVSSACTHIKCTVGWNRAEKTWDCPCHGSRFTMDGEVLTGPARKDLEVIDLRQLAEKE